MAATVQSSPPPPLPSPPPRLRLRLRFAAHELPPAAPAAAAAAAAGFAVAFFSTFFLAASGLGPLALFRLNFALVRSFGVIASRSASGADARSYTGTALPPASVRGAATAAKQQGRHCCAFKA
eukprot:354569-Chlamydomonas_euryale.AAC.1